ncbi:MAG TPA: GxxExxY protein [Gemmatimonadaceae bacterium]|nr:GxxExxY protein [Gemmatimonadaceae bacterium]
MTDRLLEQPLTYSVIGAFFEVHRTLGFGFREYVYSRALEHELAAKGHRVDREVAVDVYYRGQPIARQTLDMVVDEKLVLEIKATEQLHPNATLQLYGYLCATTLEVGLLLHFGREPKFHRVIFENRFKRYLRGNRP